MIVRVKIKEDDHTIEFIDCKNNENIASIDINSDSIKGFENINSLLLENIDDDIKFEKNYLDANKEKTIYKVAEKIVETYELEIKNIQKKLK